MKPAAKRARVLTSYTLETIPFDLIELICAQHVRLITVLPHVSKQFNADIMARTDRLSAQYLQAEPHKIVIQHTIIGHGLRRMRANAGPNLGASQNFIEWGELADGTRHGPVQISTMGGIITFRYQFGQIVGRCNVYRETTDVTTYSDGAIPPCVVIKRHLFAGNIYIRVKSKTRFLTQSHDTVVPCADPVLPYQSHDHDLYAQFLTKISVPMGRPPAKSPITSLGWRVKKLSPTAARWITDYGTCQAVQS